MRLVRRAEALFDDPGNSFDIHELEVLTDTPYFSKAASYGIRIDVPIEGRDFLFGIGRAWENTRGLSRAEIDSLLDEAGQRIGPRFSRYHAWPPILWPGQEEWSLFYAGEYFCQPFPHRISVPDEAEAAFYRLAWNPAAVVERDESTCVITSRRGSIALDPDSFRRLGEDPRYRSSADILGTLSGDGAGQDDVADVRGIVTTLVRQRLLELAHRPEPPPTLVPSDHVSPVK